MSILGYQIDNGSKRGRGRRCGNNNNTRGLRDSRRLLIEERINDSSMNLMRYALSIVQGWRITTESQAKID